MLIHDFRLKTVLALVSFVAVAMMYSCDDNTETMGTTTVSNIDKLDISTDTFNVTSRSVVLDSVLSRSLTTYLGKIRDPETGSYITCDFTTQFHSLTNNVFPEKDSITSKTDAGEVYADSCMLNLYFTSSYGDSLATMKLNLKELGNTLEEGKTYYTTYDPEKDGLIRTDGINISKSYSLADMSQSLAERSSSSYTHRIKIAMNGKYVDRDGVEYNNIGTYVMRKYYEKPEYFSNPYNFTHNVLPGFYVKYAGGLGAMAYIDLSQFNIYYTYTNSDSIMTACTSFAGTEEVLSATTVKNKTSKLEDLAADNTCTYIKSPAGLYTELTLPVEEIMAGHDKDSINAAKVVLTCKANTTDSKYNLPSPTTLLLLPVDSLQTFFENDEVGDYNTSFLTSLETTYNTYTFSNIGALVKYLYRKKQAGVASENWNKVAIVPITTTTTTISSTTMISRVMNDMSIASVKLVRGTGDEGSPLKVSVIYSRFK